MDYRMFRFADASDYTYGLLYFFNEKYPMAFTLEDEYRKIKVQGETRIPAGLYRLVLNKKLTPLTKKYRAKFSWFTWHIMIELVPGFSWVYMHIGNDDEDTDACVLVANTCDLTPPTSNGFIGESTDAFKRFYLPTVEAIEKEDCFITIKDTISN